MLSYKTTHAIQILDLLRQSKEGLSLSEIRDHFVFLPSKSFISDIVKKLEAGCLICNALPSGTRYYIVSDLNNVTLEELTRIVDEVLILSTPVGFSYWQSGYLKSHPRIDKVEQQLEVGITRIMRSVTIGRLINLKEHKIVSRQQKTIIP